MTQSSLQILLIKWSKEKYLIIELRVLLVVQDGCICLLGEQRTSWMAINALQKN